MTFSDDKVWLFEVLNWFFIEGYSFMALVVIEKIKKMNASVYLQQGLFSHWSRPDPRVLVHLRDWPLTSESVISVFSLAS